MALFIGVLPFFNYARAHASERGEEKKESRWLDDYSAPVGFTYHVQASVNAAYIWRGIYCGALSFQPTADVGYGGLYLETWWNLGAADWSFRTFEPEMDWRLGFNRWGVDVSVLYVHHFSSNLADLSLEGTNSLEVALKYTVSSKLPLSILWATRVSGRDGYVRPAGDTVRAYSSYLELSYTHRFPYEISLYGAVGMTPWHSFYTDYRPGFGVVNVELRLRKEWSVSPHCGIMINGSVVLNPSGIAANPKSIEWHPTSPWDQTINANIGFGVYLK